MKIKYHRDFLQSYKKRIAPYPKIEKRFKNQLNKFLINPKDPSLKDHKLVGRKKSFRAFSVSGDIRVIYAIFKDEIWLFDIGSHNQVY
ncbi:MAG: type II toxin-antitoxin system mRNA interferase toxin, RelE/StbE family [Candidatus Levyibacteriota bacterium]